MLARTERVAGYARTVLALSPIPPHLLRYALVGGACSGFQLLVFAPLHLLIAPLLANFVGYLLSTQVNFVLSRHVTWRHREKRAAVWRQLGEFNMAAMATVALNSLVFALLAPHLVPLGAATGALVVAAGAGYVVNSRLVFRAGVPPLDLDPTPMKEAPAWTPISTGTRRRPRLRRSRPRHAIVRPSSSESSA